MKLLILGLVVGLALGVTVGYLVWSTAPEALIPDSESRVKQGSEMAPAPTGNVAPAPIPQPVSSATPIATTPVPEGAASSLLKAVPRIEVRRGDGVIRGTVKTSAGDPLSGVSIMASPNEGPPGMGAPPDNESIEAYVARLATARLWRDQSIRKAESKFDGTYEITGLGEGTYSLVAKATDWSVQAARRSRSIAAGATVDFTATAISNVRVEIRHEDGTLPDSATITVKRGNERQESTETLEWKREEPEIRLRQGLHRVSAAVGRPATASSKEVDVQVGAATPPTIELVLAPVSSITVRVVHPPGEDVSSIMIALVKGKVTGPISRQFVYEQKQNRHLSSPGETWTYEGLEPGTFTVVASRGDGSGDVGKREVELSTGPMTVEVTLPPRDRSLDVMVVVVDAGGNPVEGVSFQATYRHDSASHGTGVPAQRAGAGKYQLSPEIPEDLRARKVKPSDLETELTARHADYGPKSVKFKLGVDRELRVAFAPTAILVVTVPGLSTAPFAGSIKVKLSHQGAEASPNENLDSARPDGDEFRFSAVASGPRVLSLLFVERHREMPIHRQPVDLPAGLTRMTLPLPRFYELRVRVPGAKNGQTVTASRREDDQSRSDWGSTRSAKLDAEGRAVFESLPEGPYELAYQGQRMQIRVPVSGEVLFEAKKDNALRVRIHDRDGLFAKSGFEDGDLIIGFGDSVIEDAEALTRKLYAAFLEGSNSASFLVQRGNRRVSVTPKGTVTEEDDAGGEIEPVRR